MYERSAIVLERYFSTILGFNNKNNFKNTYKNYQELIEELDKYQQIIEEEEKVIEEFDKVANQIRAIQQEQKKLCKINIKLEEERNKLFEDFNEEPALLEKKLEKLGQTIIKNNERLAELKDDFINNLSKFNDKQRERNKCSKARRVEENTHIHLVEEIRRELDDMDLDKIKEIKQYISSDDNMETKDEILKIMTNNGKDEKVGFNQDVLKQAIKIRNDIVRREAECYILVYERIKRLLNEIEDEHVKLEKYKKTLRDTSVKLAFLKAEKEYIVSFLDNERMTAMNGIKVHQKMMEEACEKFDLDIEQFDNLYELILKETTGKATKKAYDELYNKQYLKNIEEKERNFEQEINSIRLRTGSIINWNYWRIDGIKNIYDVFQKEVSEKFEKDLSEYKLEEADFETENYSEDEEDDEDDEYNNIDDILEYDIKTNNKNSQVKSKVRNQLLEENIEQVDDYNEYEDDDEDDYDEEDNKNNAYYKIMEQRKNSYFKNIDNNDDEQEIEEEIDLEIPEIKQTKYEIDEYFDVDDDDEEGDDEDEDDRVETEDNDDEAYNNQEDYADDEDDDDEYYEYDDDDEEDEENEGIYDIIKNSINKLEEDGDSKGLFNKFFKR